MPCKLKPTYTQKSTKINVDVQRLHGHYLVCPIQASDSLADVQRMVTILFVQYKLVTPSQMFSAWSLSCLTNTSK